VYNIPLHFASITTTMSFDWGAIFTALAPTVTIIVTWYLQRKATHDAAAKVAAVTVQTTNDVKNDASEIKQSVGAVHSLVNGQREELVRRVSALEKENQRLKNRKKKNK
jgi:cobalamin biosynthesis protein CobD/CbiB